MAWFPVRKKNSLVTADELASLWQLLGGERKVLAAGRGRGVQAVALMETLCFANDAHWEVVGWHEIWHGGWDRDSQKLYWELLDGETRQLILEQPGEIPELFSTQVGATVITQHRLLVPDTSLSVVIAARRALRPHAPIVWTVQPLGSTDLGDRRVKDFVIEATKRLKDELENSG